MSSKKASLAAAAAEAEAEDTAAAGAGAAGGGKKLPGGAGKPTATKVAEAEQQQQTQPVSAPTGTSIHPGRALHATLSVQQYFPPSLPHTSRSLLITPPHFIHHQPIGPFLYPDGVFNAV